MVETAQRDGLWDVVLRVTNEMSQDGLARFTSLPALHDPDVLRVMIRAAIAADVEILPLAMLLPVHARTVVWAELIGLGEAAQSGSVDRAVGKALERDDDGLLEELVGAILDRDLLVPSLRIFKRLSPAVRDRIGQVAGRLSPGLRLRVGAHARHLGLVEDLGPVRAAVGDGYSQSAAQLSGPA
jgi:hypothetical protein